MTHRPDLLSNPPSPLDAAIGLVAVELLEDVVVLRLDPPPAALGGDEPRPFLHGGTLATCVDTAGWYALEHASPGSWIAVDLRCDFLRLASPVPYRVVGRCLAVGRTIGTADVEITAWDEPDGLVAVGRARFLRRTDRP
jgi:acyl-coenzyme A thioesterase PaaI-like protein